MAVENLPLDTVVSSANLTGATVSNLQAADASWAVASANNVNTSVRVGFPTPATGQPKAGANLQTITVQTRKNTTNSGAPTGTIHVGITGGAAQVSSSPFNITASPASSQTNQLAFDTAAVAGLNADGSNLEAWVDTIAVGGNPSTRNSADIGFIQWVADTAPAAVNGSGAATLGAVAGSAGGGSVVNASGARVFGEILAAAAGALLVIGAGSSALADVAGSSAGAVGSPAVSGSASATITDLTGAATGGSVVNAEASAQIGEVAAAGAAEIDILGQGGGTMGEVVGAAAGAMTIDANAAAPLGDVGAMASGSLVIEGEAAVLLPDIAGSSNGVSGSVIAGSGAGIIGEVTGTSAGSSAISGAAGAPIAALVGSAIGISRVSGVIGVVLDDVIGSSAGEVTGGGGHPVLPVPSGRRTAGTCGLRLASGRRQDRSARGRAAAH